jgi:hypothetical protein
MFSVRETAATLHADREVEKMSGSNWRRGKTGAGNLDRRRFFLADRCIYNIAFKPIT